ncbi:MAG TPA: cytochrome c oxidase assembly protein [Chloroflexota bacterium]|nr:cytochrome c oxidase assembly protein [Chloroflexota bacterium]
MEPTVSAGQRLWASWNWEPSIIGGLLALATAYIGGTRTGWRRPGARAVALRGLAFLAGLLTLVVALLSPLDTLADRYLFSAHMAQHLLLLLVAPPLLLLGLPAPLARGLIRHPLLGPIERGLGHPAVALALYTSAMLGWHVPRFYEAALASAQLHAVEHLTLLTTAVLFWWPVIQPGAASAALDPLGALLYLLVASAPGTLLGAVLTFAAAPLYPTYAAADDPLGLHPLTRGAWGLTPLVDQQLGGLLMWVPGGLGYLLAGGLVFRRLFVAAAEPEPLPVAEGRE